MNEIQILFLRQPPLPAPVDPSIPSEHLRSLSVPISQFVDSRYMIPVFSAPYYEASVVPSINGGLPARESGQPSNVGLLKIWFNEGGGMAFRDAVEEVKSRREEGASNIEALREYHKWRRRSRTYRYHFSLQLCMHRAHPARRHLLTIREGHQMMTSLQLE